jgi:tripartite-type tricarboxylate transporter receptor subunit TctC
MNKISKWLSRTVVCAFIMLGIMPAHAQLQILVPFPPGGGTDQLGRYVSQALQEKGELRIIQFIVQRNLVLMGSRKRWPKSWAKKE